jgi:hypothetical protein
VPGGKSRALTFRARRLGALALEASPNDRADHNEDAQDLDGGDGLTENGPGEKQRREGLNVEHDSIARHTQSRQ